MKRFSRHFLLSGLLLFLLLFPCKGLVYAADLKASAVRISSGSWVTDTRGTHYQKADGSYVSDQWILVSGKVYRIDKNQNRLSGWFTVSGQQYYASASGAVAISKWVTYKGSRYYLMKNGIKAAGQWKKISGKYYYFKNSGKLAVSCAVGSYFVDGKGVRLINTWVRWSGKFYFYGPDGKMMKKTWIKVNDSFYYLKADGSRAQSQWIADTYYVNEKGIRQSDCVVDGYYINKKGKKSYKVFSGSYIFVGDSRMVGMSYSVSNSNIKFIAEVSSGYTYLEKTVDPILRQQLTAKPSLKVVFAHGVNDMGNIDKYLAYYKKLKEDYPDTAFYFLAVNPINEARWKSVTNAQITAFNTRLKAFAGKKYLNSYKYLKNNGFNTVDGLHYTTATYQKIYQYIMKKIS